MSIESDVRFRFGVLQHLDAAYNLARWLLGNDQDAEDVVQDSCIRAFKSFKSFRGEDGKSWLLAIVRNTSMNRLRQGNANRGMETTLEGLATEDKEPGPDTLVIKAWEAGVIIDAINGLPVEFREVVVLRELEEMSYKQIAAVTGLPMGTVMSRLARARQRLQDCLARGNGEAL